MEDTALVTRLARTVARLGRRTSRFLLGLSTFVACSLSAHADAASAGSAMVQSPAPQSTTFFEESHPAVTWSGSWSPNPLAANSGGSARLAMDAGAQATFAFTGTGVSWIGYSDEWCGIAKVFLDGVLQSSVDTYSTPAKARATLYAITGLTEGTHTLAVQATGAKNAASAGSWVWVDGFAVTPSLPQAPTASGGFIIPPSHTVPPSAGKATRASRAAALRQARRAEDATHLESDDPAVTWTGAWSINHLATHRDGSARLSMEPASRVSLVFTGTGVSWIGYKDEWSGIAEVLLDGRLRATVDTYSTPARAQAVLYTIDGLPDGAHSLTIQPTGRRRPASGGSWVWVDAFSITR